MNRQYPIARLPIAALALVLMLVLLPGSALGAPVIPFDDRGPVVGENDHRLSDMGGLGTAGTHTALDPAIAYNSTEGEFLVAWGGTEGDSATEPDRIYGQRVDAVTFQELGTNDLFLAETPGASDPKQDATHPSLAYNASDNEFLLVFVGQPNALATESEVYGQRLAADGTAIGPTFQVSECGVVGDTNADVATLIGQAVDIAYNATDNQYLVAWRCDDVGDADGGANGHFQIIGRIVNADGTLFGSDDFPIGIPDGSLDTDFDAEAPAVAWDSRNNQYLITYGADTSTLGNGVREIHGRLLSNSGAGIGGDFQISSGGNGDALISDVVYNPTNNEFFVVWAGDSVTDDEIDIFAVPVSTAGVVGTQFVIGETGSPVMPANHPNVVHNSADNEYFVTWQGVSPGTFERELFGQRLSSFGTQIGVDDQRISDLGPNGNASFEAHTDSGLAYAGAPLNTYYAVWAGTDDRNGHVLGELEIFGHAVDPVLVVEKTLTSDVSAIDAGDTFQYQIVINHQQVVEGADTHDVSLRDALNLNINDTLPAGLTNLNLVSATLNPGGTDVSAAFNVTGDSLSTVGDVDLLLSTVAGTPNQSLTLLLSAQAGDEVTPGSLIDANSVELTWQNSDSIADRPGYEASGSSESVPVVNVFGATKTASVEGATIGEVVTFNIPIQVIEGTTNNIVIDDTLPAGMVYVAGSALVADDGGMVISALNDGSAGTSVSIEIPSVVNPGNVDDPASADSDMFTISYQALVENVAGNQNGVGLENMANVSGDGVTTVADISDTVLVQEPAVTVTKSAFNLTPTFGQTVRFTVRLEHILGESTTDAHDLVIEDALPAGLTYVSGSSNLPAAQVDESGLPGAIRFTIPYLAAIDPSILFTYDVQVGDSSSLSLDDVLTNLATLTWTSLPGANANERTGAGGVNDYTDSSSVSLTVSGVDLTIEKDDGGVTSLLPGDTLVYQLESQNLGNVDANNVEVEETVPANTTFNAGASSPGWTCVPDISAGSICTNPLGTIPPSGNISVDFAVDVNTSLPPDTTEVENTASIDYDGASGPDVDPSSNSSTITTQLDLLADLQIVKSVDVGDAAPGDRVIFTLDYTNLGPRPASNVVIVDTVPAGLIDIIVSGSPVNTAPYTWDIGALDANDSGSITIEGTLVTPLAAGTVLVNSASISDDSTVDLDPTNDSSDAMVTVRNVAPTANDDSYNTDEDTVLVVPAPGLLANDTDDNGDGLSVIGSDPTSVLGAPLSGTGDGGFTYDPTVVPAFQTLRTGDSVLDSFAYRASDGTLTDDATVTISVSGVNDVPVVAPIGDDTAAEGEEVSVVAGFTDPDAGDTHTFTIDWGDGTSDSGVASGPVSGSHVYADNDSYNAQLCVSDEAGAEGCAPFTITIVNEPPTVEAGPDQSTFEGGSVDLSAASFTDPGTADTHTATVDWGDGSPIEAVGVIESPFGPPGDVNGATGSIDASHTYADSGSYVVTLSVIDDEGESGTDTLEVLVARGVFRYCLFAGDELKVSKESSISCESVSDGVGAGAEIKIEKDSSLLGSVSSFLDSITIEGGVQVVGDVTAGDEIEIKKEASVSGTVHAAGDVKLEKDSQIGGDVLAGGSVDDKGATIGGTVTEGASPPDFPTLSLDDFDFTPGSEDIKVEKESTLDLPPGAYAELKVEKGSILILHAGRYIFSEIEMKKDVIIRIDLSSGERTLLVDVAGKVKFEQGVQMVSVDATPLADQAANILFRIDGDKAELGSGGNYVGTFVVPNGEGLLEKDSTLTGALYAEKIDVKQNAQISGDPAIRLYGIALPLSGAGAGAGSEVEVQTHLIYLPAIQP